MMSRSQDFLGGGGCSGIVMCWWLLASVEILGGGARFMFQMVGAVEAERLLRAVPALAKFMIRSTMEKSLEGHVCRV